MEHAGALYELLIVSLRGGGKPGAATDDRRPVLQSAYQRFQVGASS